MNEMTKKENHLPSKEILSSYVHDAVEMELRVLTLKKTASKTKRKAKEQEEEAEKKYSRAKQTADEQYKNYQYEKYRIYTRKNYWDTYGSSIIGFIIATIFILGTVGSLLAALPSLILFEIGLLELGLCLTIIISIIILSIVIIIFKKMYPSFHKEKIIFENKKKYYKSAFENSQSALKIAEDTYKDTLIRSQALQAHAQTLYAEAGKIRSNLNQYYAMNLIPIDYRRLDCLLWIDYVFRNDQADTMREATLQCNEWIRYEDMMAALKELSKRVRSVAVLLEDMNRNVDRLNDNLFEISQNQKQQLSESQSTRYAMESLKHSNDRLVYYEDLKFYK